MVLILDGNSEHVAHAWREKSLCDCSLSNQMPWTIQITEIASHICTTISELQSNIRATKTLFLSLCV